MTTDEVFFPRPWWTVLNVERHKAARWHGDPAHELERRIDFWAGIAESHGVHPSEIRRARREARAEFGLDADTKPWPHVRGAP